MSSLTVRYAAIGPHFRQHYPTWIGSFVDIVTDARGVGRYRAAVAGLAVLGSSRTLEFLIVDSVQF